MATVHLAHCQDSVALDRKHRQLPAFPSRTCSPRARASKLEDLPWTSFSYCNSLAKNPKVHSFIEPIADESFRFTLVISIEPTPVITSRESNSVLDDIAKSMLIAPPQNAPLREPSTGKLLNLMAAQAVSVTLLSPGAVSIGRPRSSPRRNDKACPTTTNARPRHQLSVVSGSMMSASLA